MTCPVCESASIEIIRNYHSKKAIFAHLKLAQCKNCEMVFVTPMPSAEILQEYNSSYFMTAHGGIPQDIVSQSFFSGIAGLRMQHVENYVHENQLKVQNILEIGPGTGVFAKKWRYTYPDNKYYAVETDTSCYRSLEEIGVIISKPEEVKGIGKEFDLVIMSHVLEHVSDPAGFLNSSTQFLKKDGVVFIEVPCNDWQHKPEDEPHLLFFHKKPMKQFMESLGFTNIQLSYHGKTIEELKTGKSKGLLRKLVYDALIKSGAYRLASYFYKGESKHLNYIEKAVMAPFKAHITSSEPAWWLRVVAQKG
jgi:ubiquinone/menaquinone biosynthesis C-methylase UbiE